MSIVFLNGEFLPLEQARISPLDRGFLFGDGVYEVIPSYSGRLVGFSLHIERLARSMSSIRLTLDWPVEKWRDIVETLLEKNSHDNAGVYIHITRGADTRRFHGFPENIAPTVFAYTFDIAAQQTGNDAQAKGIAVNTSEDLRWKRCHIKSTSLLGNVLHFQQGQDAGVNETILYNSDGYVTEAAACNVFMVKNDTVITPSLDNQLLAGITRHLVMDILRKDGAIEVIERPVSLAELRDADEVWLTSSSKGIAPVTILDGQPVGKGEPGDIWRIAQRLLNQRQFDY